MTPARRDLLIGAGGAGFGAIGALGWGEPTTAELITAVALGAALAGSRRLPRATWLVAGAVLLAAASQDTYPGGDSFVIYGLLAAHGFCTGRWDGWLAGGAGVAVLIAASEVGALVTGDAGVPFVLIAGAAWAAGRALRQRELVAAQLAERARELEDEREAHAALSVRYERARIASELHDIVAHAISVMVVQASAGQRLAARDPELTAEAFGVIADAARRAEDDMGRLVTLLGDDDAIGPAPDPVLVEELVARATGSGLDVSLRLEGDREGLPAPVVATANRVVQEGLTNALRYASGAAVRVTLTGGGGELTVTVENAPARSDAALAGAGTGNGLRGLRERVAACGGTLDAGPSADAGWCVTAHLPRVPGRLP